MSELIKGSIIQRPMDGMAGLLFYKHIGIYVGHNQVIHYHGEGKKKKKSARIIKTSLQDFANGKHVKTRTAPKNTAHAEAICKEAEMIFEQRNNEYDRKYNLIFRNCESFAKHCYEVEY